MKLRMCSLGAVGALTLSGAPVGAAVIDFESLDQAPPKNWSVGANFSQGGVGVALTEFTQNEGGVVTTGKARIGVYAVSLVRINHFLELANITASLAVPSGGYAGFSFSHSIPSGFINLSVNGESAFIDGSNLNGFTIGGVTVSDTLTPGSLDPSRAALATFSGVVTSFSIGGSGFLIDNISGSLAPAPGAATMLLGPALPVLLRRRR